jgi:hypothetical protein
MNAHARTHETSSAAIRKSAFEKWTLAGEKWTLALRMRTCAAVSGALAEIVVKLA